MAIQNKTLSGAEHDFFATLSGLSSSAPLNEHKAKVFSDAGHGGAGKPLSQMEREWLQNFANSSKLNEGDLWREVVATIGGTPSVSTAENKFLFYSSSSALVQGQLRTLPGLLAYWPLNETSGNALNRAVSTGGTLPGTVSGVTQGAEGFIGKAYSFDGTNDDVVVSAYSQRNVNATQSIGFIATPVTISNLRIIFSTDNNSSAQISCSFTADSKLQFKKWGGTVLVTCDTVIQTGETYFILYTYDGTTHRVYINGVEDGVDTVAPNNGTPSIMKFGNWTGESDPFYSGKLQHFFHTTTQITAENALKYAQLVGLA